MGATNNGLVRARESNAFFYHFGGVPLRVRMDDVGPFVSR